MASSIFDAIQGIVGPSLTEAGRTQNSNGNSPVGMVNMGQNNSNSNDNQHFPFHPTNSRHNSASSTRHIAGHVRSRSDASSSRHHSRQSSTVDIELNMENEQPTSAAGETNENERQENGMEFMGTLTWVERGLPFVLLLLIRVLWDHRLGMDSFMNFSTIMVRFFNIITHS